MLSISNCPVCKANSFSHFLTCKDYTVSQQDFNIVQCNSCNFKFTNPRPSDSEIGSYYKSEDYISHSNTKKGIISQLYHLVRNRTLIQKEQLVAKYVSRGTILDYGCGTGMFLNTCKQKGWKTVGMEPDSDAIKIAAGMNLNVYQNKTEILKAATEISYSAITLWHVLEHVTDLEESLNFFKEKLIKEGVLVIAVPNHKSFDAEYYKQYWAAYDVPRHLYHYEKPTIVKLLSQFGFDLVETKGMKFDSFYVSMLSEKYKTGSIKYVSAFFKGLKSNLKAQSTHNYSSLIYIFKKH